MINDTTDFNWSWPIASLPIIVSDTMSVEPVVITVPVSSGKVIVLSVVGSVTLTVVLFVPR